MTSISEESFLNISASEETGCLLHTCSEIANGAVSFDKIKRFANNSHEKQENEFEREEHSGARSPVDVIISVREDVGKEVEKNDCIRDENRLTCAVSVEKVPTLADPEESESESDLKEQFVVHEIFNNDACKECFEFLEENAEQLKKLKCAKRIYLKDLPEETSDKAARLDESETFCKTSHHNVDRDLSGSFRASRGCPSQKELFLDLECRICHDVEGHDLISPCHCAGTSKWVHQSCIIRWIRQTKINQCEICTCPITVQRKKKPVNQWTRPSATCGPCNKHDIWYCFVLALCVLITIVFVVLQSHYDVTDHLELTALFASIYFLCGIIIMMKARYFWTWFVQRSSFWRNWKNLNEEWRIIEVNEANFQGPFSSV